jgi:DNA (cytosine-5)-methyltransferase 3A
MKIKPLQEQYKMKVLSLFDGISCARVAISRVGLADELLHRTDGERIYYFSSEIDSYAIQIAQKNYPDTIQLGDVKTITKDLIASYMGNVEIDLLIGGSPCQDLSIAKKNREGLKGSRSSLFYEYVRILKEIKPKYFILENVNSMPKEAKETITKELFGIEPVMINAALVSAQNRKRLFWVGELSDKRHIGHWNDADYVKVNISQPEDKGILLKDILQPNTEIDERMIVNGKSFAITASYNGAVEYNSVKKKQRTMVRVGKLNQGDQGDRIYSPNGKSVNLSANGGGRGAKTGLYIVQTPRGKNKGGKRALNGKTPTLSSSSWEHNNKLSENEIVRKLTPVECERLQSLPDNYTEGISNTQRYKTLGNAFNVEVVAHILKNLKQ